MACILLILFLLLVCFYSQTAEPSKIGTEAYLRPGIVASATQLLHDLDKQNAAETAVLTAYCCCYVTRDTGFIA